MNKSPQSKPSLTQLLLDIIHSTTGQTSDQVQLLKTQHPYTTHGVEISARWQDRWLEIGETGLICPQLLERVGIDPQVWGGYAMGWGLDRLAMIRKGLPDIRLLRDPLPAVAHQMNDLAPWKTVSRQPVAKREISVALPAGLSEEDITDMVLSGLSHSAQRLIQHLEVARRWSHSDLPEAARTRLGMSQQQENVLLKMVWQSEGESLSRDQVNSWMAEIYRNILAGSSWEYCPS